jgi:hypothetical protein
MNPELGPVVAASPERKLSYLRVLNNVISILVTEEQTIGSCSRDPNDYNYGPPQLPYKR